MDTNRMYLSGKIKAKTTAQSIIYFTLHKCASTYLQQKLPHLANSAGLIPINLDPICGDGKGKYPFHPKGFFYGPYRIPRNIPNIGQFKILLVLRDPRDVLTSMYYSTAFSHSLLPTHDSKVFNARRQKARGEGIDEHVISEIPRFLKRYKHYKSFIGKPNVKTCTYEKLVTDTDRWVYEVAEFIGSKMPEEKRKALINEKHFQMEVEDIHSNRRQIKPGDHTRKLKKETIEIINERFGNIIGTLWSP